MNTNKNIRTRNALPIQQKIAEDDTKMRDAFAMAAMQGFAAYYGCGEHEYTFLTMAEYSYDLADAMLKARGSK